MMRIALAFVFSLVTISCIAAAKRTVIRGRFEDSTTTKVSMQYYPTIADRIDGEPTTLIAELAPNTDRSFEFIIYTDEPLCFNMQRDGEPMFRNKFLASGDSVYFIFRKTTSILEYPGKESIGFQFAFDRTYDNIDSANAYRNAFKTLSRMEFAEYMKQRHDGHINFFNDYFKEIPAPALFKRVFMATEDLDFAINIAQYSWRSPNDKNALTDPKFWAYIKNLNFNAPDFFLSYRYEHFLRELPYGMWSSLAATHDNSYYKNGLYIRDSLAKHYFKGKGYDYALYHIMNDRLKVTRDQVGKPEFDTYYSQSEAVFAAMSSRFNDKKLYTRLQKRLQALKKPVKK